MKLIKQFICLVACFVVLSSSFMVGYAIDDDFEPVFPLPEDLIDMGYSMDESGNYIYSGFFDPYDFGFSLFSSSSKNFPDFNPMTDIPWSTFPQHIKDIIFMNTDDLSVAEGQPFRVPFVSAVVVSNATCQLFVGVNVGWGQINNADLSFGIWSLPGIASISAHSCLYRYAFNIATGQGTWVEYKATAYGNKGNLNRMLSYYWDNNSTLDIYGFGANGVQYPTKATSIVIPYSSTNTSQTCSFFTRPSGFRSGDFVHGQANAYPNVYFEYFSPPSQESLNQQLQEEQNKLLEDIYNEFIGSGESELTTLPGEALDDYNKAESDLVDDYNPDDLEDDLDIELDPSALSFIWDLFDEFVTADNSVFTLFLSILAIGIIALILGR